MKTFLKVLGVVFLSFIFIAGSYNYFRPTRWTVEQSVNYSYWVVEPDSMVSRFNADSAGLGYFYKPYALYKYGIGQLLAVNPDDKDTLGISFDRGVNFFKLPPNYSSIGFNPCNYDTIWLECFPESTSDTLLYPIMSWTILTDLVDGR